MSSPRYRTVLRAVYTAIIGAKLSQGEMRSLIMELRRGQIADEISFLLDQASHHFYGHVDDDESNDERVEEALQVLRQSKVSKSSLINILHSLGYSPQSTKAVTRTIMREFIEEVSASRASKLIDILRSAGSEDSFLDGISESRK
jgi:transposase